MATTHPLPIPTYGENRDEGADRRHRFTPHLPGPHQIDRIKAIGDRASELALVFNTSCPQSDELFAARKKLEEAVFWANMAILRYEAQT